MKRSTYKKIHEWIMAIFVVKSIRNAIFEMNSKSYPSCLLFNG